jgi:chromosome segregation ATPase
MVQFVADEVEKTRQLFKSKEAKLVDQLSNEMKSKDAALTDLTLLRRDLETRDKEMHRLRLESASMNESLMNDRATVARVEEEMRVILRQSEKKDIQIQKLQQIVKLMQSTI